MVDLKTRWNNLALRYNDDAPLCAEIFSYIQTSYSEPGRFYHTLDHLRALFADLDAVRAQLEQPDVVEFAVWFHDVVYDSHRGDNEAQSADLARVELGRLGVDQRRIDAVADLVLATAGHDASAAGDMAYFLDADLAILGAPPGIYDNYRAAIRSEYVWVPESDYRAGRAAVLERFTQREAIYRTAEFAGRYEAQARLNLKRELAELRMA